MSPRGEAVPPLIPVVQKVVPFQIEDLVVRRVQEGKVSSPRRGPPGILPSQMKLKVNNALKSDLEYLRVIQAKIAAIKVAEHQPDTKFDPAKFFTTEVTARPQVLNPLELA